MRKAAKLIDDLLVADGIVEILLEPFLGPSRCDFHEPVEVLDRTTLHLGILRVLEGQVEKRTLDRTKPGVLTSHDRRLRQGESPFVARERLSSFPVDIACELVQHQDQRQSAARISRPVVSTSRKSGSHVQRESLADLRIEAWVRPPPLFRNGLGWHPFRVELAEPEDQDGLGGVGLHATSRSPRVSPRTHDEVARFAAQPRARSTRATSSSRVRVQRLVLRRLWSEIVARTLADDVER
jgi:hypothetical protein